MSSSRHAARIRTTCARSVLHAVVLALPCVGTFSCAAVLGLPDPQLDDGSAVSSTAEGGTHDDANGPDGAEANDAGAQHVSRDAGGEDAATDAARCDLAKPFTAPVAIAELNGPVNDFHPTLTADELTMYFARLDPGASQTGASRDTIYRTSRSSVDVPWAAPVQVTFPAAGSDVGSPCLAADGSRLVFSGLSGANDRVYSVGAQSGVFVGGTERPVVALDGQGYQCGSVQADLTLYLIRSDQTGLALARALFSASTNTYGSASPVDGVPNDGQPRTSPVISADGRTLYFSKLATGGGDIYVAERSSTTTAFGPERRVDELSATADDEAGWLSADGCRMYLAQSAPGSGYLDLSVASRAR